MLRSILIFLLVLALTVVLGVTTHSLFVMDAWANAAGQADGSAPPALAFSDRIGWIAHDIVGMGLMYGTLVGIALAVAFVAASFLARVTGLRTIVFAVAGAVAMIVLFETLRAELGTVGVFGARGMVGTAAQAGVGALAGLLFAIFKPSET